MIDWVTAVIPFHHIPLNGGSVVKVLPSGEVDWETPCRVMVGGSFESTIAIRSQGSNGGGYASELVIDGNPSKFLQGHNIFGSDDLRALVEDTFSTVCKALDLPYCDQVLQVIRSGQYRITKVDINYMFSLGTLADVRLWLRAAEFKSKTRHGRPSSKGGTLYWGKNSRRWAIKAYSKGEEIQAGKGHKLPTVLTGTPLTEFAEDKLRLELRLLSKELDKLKLTEAHEWRGDTPYILFNDYVKRIEMSEQIALSTKTLNELPNYLRGTYILWKNGENPRDNLSKPTFYKHRKELAKFGIDINLAVESVDRSNVVPLIRVLEAKPVGIPQWAFEQNLIHHSASQVRHYA